MLCPHLVRLGVGSRCVVVPKLYFGNAKIRTCDGPGFKKKRNALSSVKQEKLMRKFKSLNISLLAFVLVALAAGCGREQAASPLSPTVIATSPANGATAVLLNATVTATFSSVMAPATINTTTFTLTGPGATVVAGAVTYSGTTATFTPTASLAA